MIPNANNSLNHSYPHHSLLTECKKAQNFMNW